MILLILIALSVFPETFPNLSGVTLKAYCEAIGLLIYEFSIRPAQIVLI
jgi:hypothetical protein